MTAIRVRRRTGLRPLPAPRGRRRCARVPHRPTCCTPRAARFHRGVLIKWDRAHSGKTLLSRASISLKYRLPSSLPLRPGLEDRCRGPESRVHIRGPQRGATTSTATRGAPEVHHLTTCRMPIWPPSREKALERSKPRIRRFSDPALVLVLGARRAALPRRSGQAAGQRPKQGADADLEDSQTFGFPRTGARSGRRGRCREPDQRAPSAPARKTHRSATKAAPEPPKRTKLSRKRGVEEETRRRRAPHHRRGPEPRGPVAAFLSSPPWKQPPGRRAAPRPRRRSGGRGSRRRPEKGGSPGGAAAVSRVSMARAEPTPDEPKVQEDDVRIVRQSAAPRPRWRPRIPLVSTKTFWAPIATMRPKPV
jgi:hypothetical protein